jgi:hypothetical protein
VKAASVALAVITAVALLAAAGCRPGGGTPEETLEAYNGAMAAKDFTLAALMIYCEAWEKYDAGELSRARAEYAGELAKAYELSGLDYGRAVIVNRDKPAPGVVRLYVEYERRSSSAPVPTYVMPFKRLGGMWYYYIPCPPGR